MSSRRIEVGIFALAFAARLAFVLGQARWALFFGGDLPGPDTRVYLDLVHSLRHGLGFASAGPIGWKESGYPFAIGPTAWVMPGIPCS
jgi:hypothetical protein